MPERDSLSYLEERVGKLDNRQDQLEGVLIEIKDAITRIVVLTEKHQALREDFTSLKDVVEDRSQRIEKIALSIEGDKGAIRGAGLVIGLLFTILAWVGASSLGKLSELEYGFNKVAKDIAVLEQDVYKQNKPVKND